MIAFMTANEAAEKWNLSKRRIIVLCNEGRIDGAQKASGAAKCVAEKL